MRRYGNYIKGPIVDEAVAKEELRKQIHDTVDELCKDESFWLRIPSVYPGDSIGWLIQIPHMKELE